MMSLRIIPGAECDQLSTHSTETKAKEIDLFELNKRHEINHVLCHTLDGVCNSSCTLPDSSVVEKNHWAYKRKSVDEEGTPIIHGAAVMNETE